MLQEAMMTGGFQWWKLDSLAEYLSLLLTLVLSGLVLYGYTRFVNGRRTDEHARRRVASRISKCIGRDAIFRTNVTLVLGSRAIRFDHLMVDRTGVVAMRTFGWGRRVRGTRSADKWHIGDNSRTLVVDNPLTGLNESVAWLRAALDEAGFGHVPVEPLLVFADTDPFESPVLELGSDTPAIVLGQLVGWAKRRAGGRISECDAVWATLSAWMSS
jgi:hypothetical protein